MNSVWDEVEGPLRFSRFSHEFVRDDVAAWYHSLHLKPIFISKRLSEMMSTYQNGQTFSSFVKKFPSQHKETLRQTVKKCFSEGILVRVKDDETKELHHLQDEFVQGIPIGVLYLLLTDKCNFRCGYCFIENALRNGYDFSVLDDETGMKAIDLYTKCLSRGPGRKTIIFYGGEPLLNLEALKSCVSHIHELKSKGLLPTDLAVTINTNGSLVTKEIADLFQKHKISVSVSIDGPKEIHDQYRRTPDNRGTFDQVIRGFWLLKKSNVNTGVSCTVGTHNVDKLPQITEWFISNLRIDFLGLNPLTDLPGKPLSSQEYIEKFSEASIQSFLIARKHGLYEDRMMRKVEAFIKRQVYPFDCAGCGRQLVVAADGKVGVCHAYTGTREFFSDTKVDCLNPAEETIWQEWSNRSPLRMPQCFDCPVLGICGGGCPYNAQINFGSIWSRDSHFCIYAKRVLKWMIWDLFEQVQKRILIV